ncbi:MAG: 4Fe-4S binding protein [Candidatus Ancaeobacter aquaticus]|nr:4Fe-4S binding protein [Candidatus Ancaeobacter aquaticus]
MKRKIIRIDEEKCNGCAQCAKGCPEGAIQMINGKAKLVSEIYCDGLGACIGDCPVDAITIEEREADQYSERKTMENIAAQGNDVIKAHLKHLKDHGETVYFNEAVTYLEEKGIDVPEYENKNSGHSACPGIKTMEFDPQARSKSDAPVSTHSELTQWPIQLHLINSNAPYFQNAELLVAADCVAFSYGNFHQKFLKGKKLIMFCPKLDSGIDSYIEKLTEIFKNNEIKSITIAHMEVPCCSGTIKVVEEALKRSGKNVIIKEYNVSLKGEII